MNAWRMAAFCTLALSASAGGVGAQAKCVINQGNPFQVNSAKMYLGKVPNAKPDEKRRHLRDAVRVLTEDGEKINNQLGRHLLLGQAYWYWLAEPNVGPVVRRGDVGLTANPDAQINLLAAVDSSFDVVEQQQPACADSLNRLRNNRGVPLINAAAQMLNEGQLDSAEALIKNAQLIYPSSAYPSYYMALVAQRRGDVRGAVQHFREALVVATTEAAAKDSTAARIRRTAMYNSAILTIQSADTLRGEAKAQAMASAAEALRTYLAEFPNAPDAPQAQTALARALGQSGDTAAVASIYSEMLANPEKYTDLQLFEAATGPLSVNRRQDAVRLLESGLAKNPYHRDALYNLAASYFVLEQPQKMMEVTRRLATVDPSNTDTWRLMAGAFQIANKGVKDEKLKRAQNDSILKYLQKEKDLPARVTFSSFRHEGARHTLRGTIENRTAKQASYSLKFEFLDAQGNVVATKTAEVGSVPPASRKDFSVEVSQTGIVAYRYEPVT